jgi:diguanylate cyclase (GGDEF)-like protein/PAS domain S-box-containing protein
MNLAWGTVQCNNSQALEQIFESETAFLCAMEAPLPVLVLDRNLNCVHASTNFSSNPVLSELSILGKGWLKLLGRTSLEDAEREVIRELLGSKRYLLETKVIAEDYQTAHIRLFFRKYPHSKQINGYLILVEDVTEHVWSAQLAEVRESRLEAVLSTVAEGVVLQDVTGQIIMANEAASRILGLTQDQLLGRDSMDPRWLSIHPNGSIFEGTDHPAMVSLRTGERQENVEMGIHKPNGELIWIRINSVPLIAPDETEPYAVVASFTDVSVEIEHKETLSRKLHLLHEAHVEIELKQKELELVNEQLRALSNTDALTGLKNRRALQERLETEATLSTRYHHSFALVLIDVDHFKAYNDTFGHIAGDDILAGVAQIFKDSMRTSDFVARYGGEEFAMILPHTNLESAMLVADRVRRSIENFPWELRPITISVGVAEHNAFTPSVRHLTRAADHALYASKAGGRNRVTAGYIDLAEVTGNTSPKTSNHPRRQRQPKDVKKD